MKKLIPFLLLFSLTLMAKNSCVECGKGIEDSRERNSV